MADRDMIYLGDNQALTRTIFGQKMYVDTRDRSLAPHILLDGYWEMWITKFFQSIVRPGMTMVEVGSNIGYYTLLAASYIGGGGKVYAFEANPEVFEILCRNVDINGFLNWTVLTNMAVSDKSQMLQFNKLKFHQGGSSIVSFDAGYLNLYRDQVESIEVKAVSLDEFFAGKNPTIDLIKMDAEGSEGLIFRGMEGLLRRNPQVKIITEFSPGLMAATGIQPRKFLTILVNSGFKPKVINSISRLEDISIDSLVQIQSCELFLSKGG